MKNLRKPKPYSTSLKKPKPENFETEPALMMMRFTSKTYFNFYAGIFLGIHAFNLNYYNDVWKQKWFSVANWKLSNFFQILDSNFSIIASFKLSHFLKKKLVTLLQSHKFQTILIKQWTDENAHSANIFGLNYFFSRSFLLRLLLQFYSVLLTSNYFMSKMGILQSWQHCIFQTHIMKNKAFTIIKFPTSIWKHN